MPRYTIQQPGDTIMSVGADELAQMALSKAIKADTVLLEDGTERVLLAKQVPGVFSPRQWIVAGLLSIFLGYLAIDRFYVGHYVLGVLKIITLGGFGLWYLIDIALFATHSVRDRDGLPLS